MHNALLLVLGLSLGQEPLTTLSERKMVLPESVQPIVIRGSSAQAINFKISKGNYDSIMPRMAMIRLSLTKKFIDDYYIYDFESYAKTGQFWERTYYPPVQYLSDEFTNPCVSYWYWNRREQAAGLIDTLPEKNTNRDQLIYVIFRPLRGDLPNLTIDAVRKNITISVHTKPR